MEKKSVLLIADPLIPVPPIAYGGAERIVDLLANGLIENGWRVTLACHPDSTSKTILLPHASDRADRVGRMKNMFNLLKHVAVNRYDLVHTSAHYDLTASLWPLPQKVIQTFHALPDWNPFMKRVKWVPKRNLWFTTVGKHMVNTFSGIAPTHGIHNAIDLDEFTFQGQAEENAPLVFLGRIEQIKGTHTAIQIAKNTNRRLMIAGNRSNFTGIDRYFKEQVEPHLSEDICYLGEVNSHQRNELLGSAAALLMPIEWEEPFGLVMAEALACGTPVIGLARGALPEIVHDGTTGACCHSVEEMIGAVRNLEKFSRRACRQEAEHRFSAPVMVDHYLALYEQILAPGKSGTPIGHS